MCAVMPVATAPASTELSIEDQTAIAETNTAREMNQNADKTAASIVSAVGVASAGIFVFLSSQGHFSPDATRRLFLLAGVWFSLVLFAAFNVWRRRGGRPSKWLKNSHTKTPVQHRDTAVEIADCKHYALILLKVAAGLPFVVFDVAVFWLW